MTKPGDNFSIRFESEGFPHARGIPACGRLDATWDDILWAALTVGRPPTLRYIFRHGPSSLYEALFRCSLVLMGLEQEGSNRARLRRTSAFKSLDPTEKGAVNYFLGMVFCKLFAAKFLGTALLLHFDVFRDFLGARLLKGRSRPDLVGFDPSVKRWHAFECKGRSAKLTTIELAKAKEQAARVASVQGTDVDLHVATVSYFKRDTLRFYWCNADLGELEKLERIDVKLPATAWRDYFEPASEVMRMSGEPPRAARRAEFVAPIEELDVRVEAHREIRQLLLDRDWSAAYDVAREFANDFLKEGFRPDGLKVKAGGRWRQPREAEESG